MEWFKANPGGGGEDGGPNLEQYSVQDDNSDTSSVAGTDSTSTTAEMNTRAGMFAPLYARRRWEVTPPAAAVFWARTLT